MSTTGSSTVTIRGTCAEIFPLFSPVLEDYGVMRSSNDWCIFQHGFLGSAIFKYESSRGSRFAQVSARTDEGSWCK